MFRSKSLASVRCQYATCRPRRGVRFASTIQVQRVRFRRPFPKSALFFFLGYVGYSIYTMPSALDSPEIQALEEQLIRLPENDPSRASKKSELEKIKRESRKNEVDKYGEKLMSPIHKKREQRIEYIKRQAERNAAAKQDTKASQADRKPQSSFFFIPLWPVQQMPKVLYHSQHPDWLEFVKFSRDVARQQRVKAELANTILSHFEALPNKKVASIGKPISIRRSWLDVDYPSGPRPQYVQWGLVIRPEEYPNLAFQHKLVDDTTYYRLMHTLKPYALTLAAWTGYSTLVQHNWNKIKVMFQSEKDDQLKGLQSHLGITTVDAKTFNRLMQKPRSNITGSAAPSPALLATAKQAETGEEDLDEDTMLRCPPYVPSEVCQAIAPAVISFRQTLRKIGKPPFRPSSNGCVVVSGLVEFEGTRGIVIFDVQAYYNPKSSAWEAIYAHTRRGAPKAQNPMGSK